LPKGAAGYLDARPASWARRGEKRNIANDSALPLEGYLTWRGYRGIEGTMATREHHQIVETPTEARQAEPGPSVLALLAVSTGLAMLILGMIWFVLFRG
jgi:hypothetical protein